MNMKNILLYLVVLITLVGCNKEFDDVASTGGEVRISSSIATRVSDSQWEEMDEIGVYMTSSSDDSSQGDNIMYKTTDGTGYFTSDAPLSYPESGSVNLFAYYPYVVDVDLSAYSIDSNHQIDLLYAKTESSVSSSSSDVELTFNHLLSKISLSIVPGSSLGYSDLENLSVKLLNINTTANFDINNKKVCDDSLGTNGDISLITKTTTTEAGTSLSANAIVIPQTLSDATLYFTTESYGTFYVTLTTTAFEVGTEYSYTITIDFDGVLTSNE